MHKWSSSDTLNRTAKMALDRGEAKSLEEAEKIFSGYRLAIVVGPKIGSSPTLQATLLTVVNAARRCFLGGVQVGGYLETPLKIPWKNFRCLKEAVRDLGGHVVDTIDSVIPCVIIGDAPEIGKRDFSIKATFEGWSGGIIPYKKGEGLPERQEFITSGVLSGSLAVAEAFQFVRGTNVMAGRRRVGLSLWRPNGQDSWEKETGPEIRFLPDRLWIIGLGHLGQSFLWNLGLLPFAQPEKVRLILQDYDKLVEANESTSPLTFTHMINKMKTRSMAKWAEARGFLTKICEREFAANFKVAEDEPGVAICGVDNYMARSALEKVGFSKIIEAGLGTGPNEFLAFQMHTFPGPLRAEEKWDTTALSFQSLGDFKGQPAYRALMEEGADQCGVTRLAGRSVGASFVGLFTAALVTAEILRMVNGFHQYALIDGDLRSPDHVKAIMNDSFRKISNPGITRTRA